MLQVQCAALAVQNNIKQTSAQLVSVKTIKVSPCSKKKKFPTSLVNFVV